MKPANLLIATLTALAAALTGCHPSDGDQTAPPTAAAEPKPAAAPGVTLDAATQERLGLKMEAPAPAQWQPVIPATGRVANPLALLAAASDYETARAAAAASQQELARTQKLAAQQNASPRALESAQAAATRDVLAQAAARAKFTADWGPRLAAQTNLVAYAETLQSGEISLVRLFLPAGVFPNPLPAAATVNLFSRETNSVPAELADNLNLDPATQVQTLLFLVRQKLPPDAALEARLKTAGEPLNGVSVPASAVLRHEGKGWAYVEVETNRFVRTEIPLDRRTDGGWFVAAALAATNRIVVTGAQSVLSAELSGGGFNTGERD